MILSSGEFDAIAGLVKQQSGLAMGPEKEYLVQARLRPLLERHGLRSFAELIARQASPQAHALRAEIVDAMTTKETSFFRDSHPFETLRKVVLPKLVQRFRDQRSRFGPMVSKIRIWSAAASTGQEPYSLAMTILDFLENEPNGSVKPEQFWIFASDISPTALETARQGIYTEHDLARGLTPALRSKYFVSEGRGGRVSAAVRKLVEFQRFNLVEPDRSLSGFDLVLCRNALIYFEEPVRAQVCQQIHTAMNPDGVLMIGAAESLPAAVHSKFQQSSSGLSVIFLRKC